MEQGRCLRDLRGEEGETLVIQGNELQVGLRRLSRLS